MKRIVKIRFATSLLLLISATFALLFYSCRKTASDEQMLSDVSGIYHCNADSLADSTRASYIFVFREQDGKLHQGLVILWMRKQGDTAATYHLEGQLDIRLWQRNSEGQLLMEAVSDLGFPAGKVELSGVFSAGIQFDFSAVNDLFSDNGIVKRVSGEEIPVSKIAQVESSFIGDWDFNFGSGSKRCIDNAVCGDWPEPMPGFTSFVTIEDENASVNATTIFGWFEGPNPWNPNQIYYFSASIFSLIIAQPYGYTEIEIGDNYISCITSDEWLCGLPFTVTYCYSPGHYGASGGYYNGDLNITPSDAKN